MNKYLKSGRQIYNTQKDSVLGMIIAFTSICVMLWLMLFLA